MSRSANLHIVDKDTKDTKDNMNADRSKALEAALSGTSGNPLTILDAYLAPLTPIDDLRATAAYRRHAVGTLLQRTLAA